MATEPTGEWTCEGCQRFAKRLTSHVHPEKFPLEQREALLHILWHLGHQARPVEPEETNPTIKRGLCWIEISDADRIRHCHLDKGHGGRHQSIRDILQASGPAAQSPAEESPALAALRSQLRAAALAAVDYATRHNEPAWTPVPPRDLFTLLDAFEGFLVREKAHQDLVAAFKLKHERYVAECTQNNELRQQVEQLQRDLAASISVSAYDEAITERDAWKSQVEATVQSRVVVEE